MYIPVRCFSCGKPTGHMWEEFIDKVAKAPADGKDAARKNFFSEKGLERYCCRATLMTHIELDDIAKFRKF